jgi:CheY-like chemotaxis protein
LLTIIKSDPDLKRIPVIMMTSSNAEIDVLKSYDLRANSYIVKPVEFGRLQEVIASLDLFWRKTATLPSSSRTTGDDS